MHDAEQRKLLADAVPALNLARRRRLETRCVHAVARDEVVDVRLDVRIVDRLARHEMAVEERRPRSRPSRVRGRRRAGAHRGRSPRRQLLSVSHAGGARRTRVCMRASSSFCIESTTRLRVAAPRTGSASRCCRLLQAAGRGRRGTPGVDLGRGLVGDDQRGVDDQARPSTGSAGRSSPCSHRRAPRPRRHSCLRARGVAYS